MAFGTSVVGGIIDSFAQRETNSVFIEYLEIIGIFTGVLISILIVFESFLI